MKLRVVAVAASLSLLAACGDQPPEVAPPRVDMALAPQEVGTDLGLYENKDKETLAAFRNAGDKSLASDGHIWEIRRHDRLIGTLQITTVLPKIDLERPKDRDRIVGSVIPGRPLRRRIEGIEVFTVEVDDKATFVWFADGLYEIVQIKDRTLKVYEPIVADIIGHQRHLKSFTPLKQ